MNTNEIENNDNQTGQDTQLADLEPAAKVNGGSRRDVNDIYIFRTPNNNHNETTVSDEADAPLADLEPTDEVRGGTGTGVLTLSGTNTYTGATTVNQGTLNGASKSGVGLLKSLDGGKTWV